MPHAGGTFGFYRNWLDHLSDDVELVAAQYPGRQDRLREEPLSSIHLLADEIAACLVRSPPPAGVPWALFGHSMGGTVAFETALRLAAYGIRTPDILVISSAVPEPEPWTGPFDDAALIKAVGDLGAVDAEVLSNPEMLDLVLPSVRADYAAMRTYRPTTGQKTTARVLACVGSQDAALTLESMQAWADRTSNTFESRAFEGGHFYLAADPADLIEAICAEARPTSTERSGR